MTDTILRHIAAALLVASCAVLAVTVAAHTLREVRAMEHHREGF